MADIGATLREARMRSRVDVSEIEAQTKIRAKYLRALENEEWSLLPGPTFVKSFLRTYAEALGLDGRALVEDYRLHHERPPDGDRFDHAQQARVASGPNRSAPRGHPGERPRRGGSRAYLAVVGAVSLVIVLLIVGLLSNHGSSSPSSGHTGRTSHSSNHHATASTRTDRAARQHHSTATATHPTTTVTVALTPAAPVWVCLIGDNGERLIPGETLQPGTTVEHHATKGHFEMKIGNTSLQLKVNGREMNLGPRDEAIGFTITKAGLTPLTPGPECG
jgi:cytoskeletal protein RodZ